MKTKLSISCTRESSKKAFAAFIASFALTACSSLTIQAANQYWDEFGEQPVAIKQINGQSQQILNFVDFKDGMLVAKLEGGIGEISIPVSDSMVNTLQLNVKSMGLTRNLLSTGNYTGALTTLRPDAYPLIKFSEVPSSFVQLHTPVQTLIETLIVAGELDEAQDIIDRIPLEKTDKGYSATALQLTNAYLEKKDFQKAASLAQAIPVEGTFTSNIRPVLNIADALRGAQEYKAVIPLYKSIRNAVPENLKRNVDMWLAYSLVLNDQVDEATPMIEALEEPTPNDRLFSLYKLLQGSKAYREGEYSNALDVLTRGFVRAQTSYVWVPEMLFLIGDCYARAGDPMAAQNVWKEIAVLYPTSPWAERAEDSLSKLPKAS